MSTDRYPLRVRIALRSRLLERVRRLLLCIASGSRAPMSVGAVPAGTPVRVVWAATAHDWMQEHVFGARFWA